MNITVARSLFPGLRRPWAKQGIFLGYSRYGNALVRLLYSGDVHMLSPEDTAELGRVCKPGDCVLLCHGHDPDFRYKLTDVLLPDDPCKRTAQP